MGIRFRKSFKVAPGVRVNLNKKSAGITVGGKGAKYTVNTSGQRTASAGIPGTGLSYVDTSKGKSKQKKSGDNKTSSAKSAAEPEHSSAVNISQEPKKKEGNCSLIGMIVIGLGIVSLFNKQFVGGILMILAGCGVFAFIWPKLNKAAESEENKLYELQQLLYGTDSEKGSVPESEIITATEDRVASLTAGLGRLAEQMGKATSPKEFFESYSTLKDKLDNLILFEPFYNFETSPSELRDMLFGENSTSCIDFVKGYYENEQQSNELLTEKARAEKYQRLYDSVEPYLGVMDKASCDYIKEKSIEQGILKIN